MNFFRRKPDLSEEEKPDPREVEASSPEEYFNRGMLFYSDKSFEKAAADFKQAVAIDAELVDPHYGLGLVYKATGRTDEAADEFNKVLELLNAGVIDDNPNRKNMLLKISQAHIKSLSSKQEG